MITPGEKRSSERYSVHCMVTFAEQQGWSRDISATGMYFLSPQKLEPKQLISMTIHLNCEPAMQCKGKVIRTEEQPNGYGVAVQFTDLAIAA